MILQALSVALGLSSDPLESDNHQERAEAHAAHAERIRKAAESRAAIAGATFRNDQANDRAALEAATAKANATRKRLGKEIAEELRAAVAEPWQKFVSTEPSRALAFEMAKTINAASTRAFRELGAPLWDRAVYLAFIAPYAVKYPSLVGTLASDIHGQHVAIGAGLIRACSEHRNGVDVVAVYAVLLELEKHLSELVARADTDAPNTGVRAEFDLALQHAARTDHHAALEAHRAAADALTMASLPQNSGPVAGIRNTSGTTAA